MPIFFDVLFVVIAVIFITIGVRKGFIKSLIQSAKLLITIVVTYFVGPITSTFLKDGLIYPSVYDAFYKKADELYTSVGGSIDAFRQGIADFLKFVPEFLLNAEKREAILEDLAQKSAETGTAGVESIAADIANPVADVSSAVLGYVLTFVLALILVTVLAWLLNEIADRVSIFGAVNSILGGVFGALKGIIILMIFAAIIGFIDAKGAIYPDTVIVKWLGDFWK